MAATEYMYVVGTYHNLCYILHQKNSLTTQLLAFDETQNRLTSALTSYCNPAWVRIAPDGTIGFIENDHVRIVVPNKRSVKTVLFDEPLSKLGALRLLD